MESKSIKRPFPEMGVQTYEEYLVYEVLRGKAKSSPVTPNRDRISGFYPDFYLPQGIPWMSMKGETVVEVKRTLSHATIKVLDVLWDTFKDRCNVVIVYFDSTLSSEPIEKQYKGKTYKYISFNEFKKRGPTLKKEKAFYSERAKTQDWKEARNEIIRAAQDVVKQENNALFLGAGVSKSAKMPSWDDLLRELMGEVGQLKGETRTAFKELSSHVLNECGNSQLIMARYLETAIRLYDDKAVFPELIQRHLYNGSETSDLLKVLSRIVQLKKVKEIVTYNFDDILEQNLANLGLRDSIDYTSISKDAEIKGHNTLPIYHVHGIIPKEGPVDTVVFTEEEYHKRYSDAFHWSNVEQLHALSRMHCFFVGLSMTDPNQRRLLDVAHNMNKTDGFNHFAFLKRTLQGHYCTSAEGQGCKYVHVSESLIDRKKQKEIYLLNYSVIEKIFEEMGVKIIWFEDFDELPELVERVFGLSSEDNDNPTKMISEVENAISIIREIEDEMREGKNSVSFISFIKNNKDKYQDNVLNASRILTALTNELAIKMPTDDLEVKRLNDLLNQLPQYRDNTYGYSAFYSEWLDRLKLLRSSGFLIGK